MYTLEGISRASTLILPVKSVSKTETPIFYLNVFFVSKGNLFFFFFFFFFFFSFLLHYTAGCISAIWRYFPYFTIVQIILSFP